MKKDQIVESESASEETAAPVEKGEVRDELSSSHGPTTFYIPSVNMNVEADTLEEAIAKAGEIIKNKGK